MRKVSLTIIVGLLLCSVSAFAESCYKSRVETGDYAVSRAQYDRAIAYYEAAKKCVDAPQDLRSLNRKIANAKSKKEELENRITVSLTDISFEASGNYSKSIQVTSRRKWSYNASQVPYWLTVDKVNNSLTVSCADNKVTQSRSFELVISNGKGVSKKILIEQKAKKQSYISLSEYNLRFSGEGGSAQPIAVYTDAENFTAKADKNGWWLDVKRYGSDIHITAYKNTMKFERDAKVRVVTDDGSVVTIGVTQERKPHSTVLRSIGLRGGGSIEAFLQFNVKDRSLFDIGIGRWNQSEAWGLTGTYDYMFLDGVNWNSYIGAGLALGVESHKYGLIGALAGNLELEYIGLDPFGIAISYTPKIGYGTKGAFFGDYINFNVVLRYYLDWLDHR